MFIYTVSNKPGGRFIDLLKNEHNVRRRDGETERAAKFFFLLLSVWVWIWGLILDKSLLLEFTGKIKLKTRVQIKFRADESFSLSFSS